MKRFLSENNSQYENDHFILECIFFLIIITIVCLSIKNRKKLYTILINNITNVTYSNFRLLTGLLIIIVISTLFVINFIKKVLF